MDDFLKNIDFFQIDIVFSTRSDAKHVKTTANVFIIDLSWYTVEKFAKFQCVTMPEGCPEMASIVNLGEKTQWELGEKNTEFSWSTEAR